nr:hypothetical protein [uncultured Bacillus sp.]
MQEHSRHRHHRYISSEENFADTKEDVIAVLVNRGVFQKWSVNGHIDYPFEPNMMSENSVLEGKTQPYIQYNEIL